MFPGLSIRPKVLSLCYAATSGASPTHYPWAGYASSCPWGRRLFAGGYHAPRVKFVRALCSCQPCCAMRVTPLRWPLTFLLRQWQRQSVNTSHKKSEFLLNRFFLQVVKAANAVCSVSAPSIKPSCCKQDTSSVYRGCSHAPLAFSFPCVF